MSSIQSSNHYLTKDGSPFLYLGDTEWVLNNHSDTQVKEILDDRAEKGFTVVQVLLSRSWYGDADAPGWGVVDANNNAPFINHDPTRLNQAYWQRWQWIADEAAARKLQILVVVGDPIRGDSMNPVDSPAEAYEYGRLIGQVFQGKGNVIFGLGQDNGGWGNDADETRAMAEGIADGQNGVNRYDGTADYTTTLMTFHACRGTSSSQWFQNDAWIDVHGTQVPFLDGGNLVGEDYGRANPTRPVINLEDWYEDSYDNPNNGGPITAHQIRIQAFKSFFSGAAGYTYGHTENWRQHTSTAYLDDDGAQDVARIGTWVKAHEWWKWTPDASIIDSGGGWGDGAKVAVRASDGSALYVYFPDGSGASIASGALGAAGGLSAAWWNPDTGETKAAGALDADGKTWLQPPGGWADAVLMVTKTGGGTQTGTSTEPPTTTPTTPATAGATVISGTAGHDKLQGTVGDDVMVGGLGADTLSGGAGRDVFRYTAVAETDGSHGYDSINGFDAPGKAAGDVIDLSRIDADPATTGIQAFKFVGTGELERGTIRLIDHDWADHTMVQGLTKDGSYFHLWINDGAAVKASAYTADDFLLAPGTVAPTPPTTTTPTTTPPTTTPTTPTTPATSTATTKIKGTDGHDNLQGTAGNDLMLGGLGADTLTGGAGRDVFRYTAVAETDASRGFDYINGFDAPGKAAGDRIDLARIDADLASAGDQAVTFAGTGELERGSVRLIDHDWGNHTMVQGLTKDGAYFHLWINDGADVTAAAYTAADFLL